MIAPQPPQWALDAGAAEPLDGETFSAYCERIMVPPEVAAGFFDGLTERTAPLANARLAAYLMEMWPEAFRAGVAALAEKAAEQARAAAVRAENEMARRTLASVRREVYS